MFPVRNSRNEKNSNSQFDVGPLKALKKDSTYFGPNSEKWHKFWWKLISFLSHREELEMENYFETTELD